MAEDSYVGLLHVRFWVLVDSEEPVHERLRDRMLLVK